MKRARLISALLGLALLSLGAVPAAQADRDGRGHAPAREFHAQHWVLDSRFHHDHYYPRVGYSLSILPPGYLDIRLHDRHFFFNAGVWFVRSGPAYVVATPPAGLLIPALPPAYTTVWIGSEPYYYANGTYYAAAPGGYTTVAPPAGADEAAESPLPPPEPTPDERPIQPANDLLFVIPLKNQSDERIASDRMECSYWAIGKTGYDPSLTPADDPRRGDYLRAVSGCLEARDYRVK